MGWDPNSILKDPLVHHHLGLLPLALHYCVNGLADMFHQISIMCLLCSHMWSIYWLKCWSVEPLCKKCLELLPSEREHIFGLHHQKKEAARPSKPETRKSSFCPSHASRPKYKFETHYHWKTWTSKPARSGTKTSSCYGVSPLVWRHLGILVPRNLQCLGPEGHFQRGV